MPAEVEALVDEARAALAEGNWQAARSAFETTLEHDDSPEALIGLSDALWWLGDTDGAVRCAERAYAGFRRRDEPLQAAVAAITLYFHYRVSLGNTAAARGWMGRAARLVENFELDLVVCDVEMPGGSGFDRIRSVRERGGDLAVATC